MSAKRSRMATKAIGQRKTSQNHVNAPRGRPCARSRRRACRRRRSAGASRPARARTRGRGRARSAAPSRSVASRAGRRRGSRPSRSCSSRRCRPRRAPKAPRASATTEPPPAESLLELLDQVADRLRRDRVEEALQRVVGADQAEDGDEERPSPGRTRAASCRRPAGTRPMQSSARNCRNVRLKTATHSAALTPPGARQRARQSRATERPRRRSLPAASKEAHRRADAACDDEPDAESARRDDRQLRAQLGADVGRLGDSVAKRVDGAGQLLALGLDLQADLFGAAAVTGHCSSTRSVVSFASWIACSGTGGVPFLILALPRGRGWPRRAKRPRVTMRRASHQGRKVASPAATVANRKPSA